MNSLFSKIFLLTFFVSISVFAQSSKDEKSGNTYFEAFNYRKAMKVRIAFLPMAKEI